jgi:DNA polymerase III epsilon subunit-like protein
MKILIGLFIGFKAPNNLKHLLLLTAKFSRYYLDVPYTEKDDAKILGASWDQEKKKWFISDKIDKTPFKSWKRIYLNISDSNLPKAKLLGAIYDGKEEKYYVLANHTSLHLFSDWIDSEDTKNYLILDETSRTGNVLLLKIETTGLPMMNNYGGYYSYEEIDKYENSRLVQISSLLCDATSLAVIIDRKAIIKSPEYSVAESQKYHKISQETVNKEGLTLEDAIQMTIGDFANRTSLLVSHNALFNMNIIKSELFRRSNPRSVELLRVINNLPVVCTMRGTKPLVQSKGVSGNIKMPKLEELMRYAQQIELENNESLSSSSETNRGGSKLQDLHVALRTLVANGIYNMVPNIE